MLEIGCGTGQLTELLVTRGLAVDAVDTGPQLIAAAQQRVGGSAIRFHLGGFEDINLSTAMIDAAGGVLRFVEMATLVTARRAGILG